MENGKPLSYQFNGGYCSLKDNVTFYFYNQDHLGNNRTVINSTTGKAEQTINYYPFGTPYCDSTSVNPGFQKFKYNGKELDMMHGLNTYDYGARQYYSVVPAWDRIDPLCEKYYSISPYAYCANNPVNLIDLDGRKIDTSDMSEEELEKYNEMITNMSKSELFAALYKELVESNNIIKVSLGDPKSLNNESIYGQFTAADDNNGGSVVLSKDAIINKTLPDDAVAEELFHAYQNINKDLYTGSFNREFEAKTFNIAMWGIALPYSGIGDWGYDISDYKFGDEEKQIILMPSKITSSEFLNYYKTTANSYAEYNRRNKIGNINYQVHTYCNPMSLIRIVNKTYKSL